MGVKVSISIRIPLKRDAPIYPGVQAGVSTTTGVYLRRFIIPNWVNPSRQGPYSSLKPPSALPPLKPPPEAILLMGALQTPGSSFTSRLRPQGRANQPSGDVGSPGVRSARAAAFFSRVESRRVRFVKRPMRGPKRTQQCCPLWQSRIF